MEIKYLLAFGISLVATLVVILLLVPFLHKIRFGQSICGEGPQSHMAKAGIPTMGGLVFINIPILVMLVLDYKAFFSRGMLICIPAYLGYALIGFIDDFLIVVRKDNDGLKSSAKFLMQSVLAVIFYLFYHSITGTTLTLPVIHISLRLGILYFVLIFFMFTCESNAVDPTGGLDGLCARTSIIATAPFVIFTLLQGNKDLTILFLVVCGSLLEYLRFNVHPAKILMGGTDSLAISGLLTASAMILKQELLLVVISGVFVMELPSVTIQVTNYKTIKKRVLRITPSRYYFEPGDMKEAQVVLMFQSTDVIPAAPGLWLGVM